MSIYEHNRFAIVNPTQHLFKHTSSGLAYVNPRVPTTNISDTMDYIIAHLYPSYVATVATVGDLPGSASINDYYVVNDDGDGKMAGYVWSKIDNVEQFIKRYDVDWSMDAILAESAKASSYQYVHKWGFQDRDENAALFAGDLAGQRIYGGLDANEHLILYANAGDAAGNTGFIQAGDNFRPLTDSTFSSGTNTYRWLNVYTDNLISGTMTITGGSITDSSGAISFGNENLLTTGTFGCGVLTAASGSSIGTLTLSDGSITDSGGSISFGDENLSTTGTFGSGTITVSSDMTIATGSITSASGAISFGNENLSTTGTLGAGVATFSQTNTDFVRIDGNGISITNADTNLDLSANGTGVIDLLSNATCLNLTATGTVGITGQLNADNLRIDGNTLSSTDTDGNIIVDPNGAGLIEFGSAIYPTTDSSWDIGKSGNVWNDLWIDNAIQDGTNAFLIADLMPFRSAVFRDAGRTQAAQAGDGLFYNGSVWLASVPDSEIAHNSLGGLTTTDAGHTQFVMLAGRVGGQTVQGGTTASENLTLGSTAHATKGDIFFSDDLLPTTDAVYTTSWAGTDIGGSSNYIRDLYSKGEFRGFRLENFATAGRPANSAANIGRMIYDTDDGSPYVDTGSAWVPAGGGGNKHVEDLVYNGSDLVKNVDVSANIDDARNSIIQLRDNTNNFEQLYVQIEATTASNVRITTTIPLPAGSYRLIVME